MKSIGEFFILFFLYFKVICFHFLEERKVKKLFYGNTLFQKVDKSFKRLYLFKNPYKICKRFKRANIYGETPLTVFHQIFIKGELSSQDTFVDLGCGRGRGVFFAQSFWKSYACGVDFVPLFCKQAQKLASFFAKPPQFFCQDFSFFNLQKGSFFYFYSICLEEEELLFMISRLETIKKGSKVVTVSFPLTDYSGSFSLSSSWESCFPWGKAELFLNVKS